LCINTLWLALCVCWFCMLTCCVLPYAKVMTVVSTCSLSLHGIVFEWTTTTTQYPIVVRMLTTHPDMVVSSDQGHTDMVVSSDRDANGKGATLFRVAVAILTALSPELSFARLTSLVLHCVASITTSCVLCLAS